MGVENLIAKALGISDEEIAAASLDPETAEIVKTAEDLIADVRSGKISREDLSKEERETVEKADESTDEPGSFRSMETEEITIEQAVEDHDERLAKIEDKLDSLPAEIAKAIKDSEPVEKKEEDEPSAKDLGEKLDKLATDTASAIEKLGEDVEKLGEGGSSQREQADAPRERERITKIYEDAGLDPDLAGIL